ncbi:MAG: DNA-3-methyladenine glycosylase 2 family protein [Acidimicrobiia bacterium]|nr:DNA-3-methyladenine glycosylase 2 family protein [Acidimicrobiia bacterium]
MFRRTIPLASPLALEQTLAPLRLGQSDPTMVLSPTRVLLATRTPDGPATVEVQHCDDAIEVEAWGDGAEWALAQAPAALGVLDDPADFHPSHPVVRQLHEAANGLRLPRTALVFDAVLSALLRHQVTRFEARRSFQQLVERWGEPAPGPGGLRLRPDAHVLAALGEYELHAAGVEAHRADALKRASAHASRIEATAALPGPEMRAALELIPGITAWTAAESARVAAGDSDAIGLGDPAQRKLIGHTLRGGPEPSDEQLLELLEEFTGQRGRVCVLIEWAALSSPLSLGEPRTSFPAPR